MSAHGLISVVRDHIGELSPLDLVELLVTVKNEIHGRGQIGAANFIARALYCYAQEVSGPDVPSDNGASSPGDTGADS